MGEVLSQNEIDNLLAALSSGELDADDFIDADEKQVKDYDFSRPSKFSKDHLRTLNIIFEHYSRLLSTTLPAYLRKNVQVDVVNSEAVTYSEFTNALSNPVLLGIVDFAPLEGNIIIELANNIGYAIVDRMLGGGGYPLEKIREFSEIELSIIERIFVVFTDLLREPWANVVDLNPRLLRIETNSQFAQIISPNEMISIVTLNLKIGNLDGMMNICLPYVTLEKVIDNLSTKYWFSTMQVSDNKSYKDIIEVAISNAKIPLRAVLGKSTISINEFLNMQEGDVIKLNTKIGDEVKVFVGNIEKLTAFPGSSSGNNAVKVSTILKGEE
mgnify:FL=1